jgi:hypothetical protein
MKSSIVVKNLEVALIELEYALADFSYRLKSTRNFSEAKELESLLWKLVAAKCTIENAISALGKRSATEIGEHAA